MDEPRLMIIDGYSLLYRAFFATGFLTTTDGRPTNALYGFTSMLFNLIDTIKPAAVVVALDGPGKTFRHVEFDAYKGTRKETADELKVQLNAARELIEALRIPAIEATGYEADDVVGTISKLAEENGYCTTIVTGDLDSLQLVDDKVSVLTPRKGVADTMTYDPAAVVERYGVGPEFIADFKALKGDTSDNIPGVPGIGDKSAAEIVQKFGHVEDLVTDLSRLEPKYYKKCQGMEEQILLCKKLATIVRDVPLEYGFKAFQISENELDEAVKFLESYEFKSLVRRAPFILKPYLYGADASDHFRASVEAETITATLHQIESFEALGSRVGTSKFAAYFPTAPAATLFDETEAKGYVALGEDVFEAPANWVADLVLGRPKQALVHDSKPLYRAAKTIPDEPVRFDSLIAGFVLQSGRTSYSLRDLIVGYLDVAAPTSIEQVAAGLWMLEGTMKERLDREGQMKVFAEVEAPLIPILAQMEAIGIRANKTSFREFAKILEADIERTQTRVFELAGMEFLIASPKQLGEVLFEKLGIPGAQKTKTGYATGVEVLGELAAEYEIASEVLNWRELSKLKSTYADSLEKLVRDDGRIHTTYNQTGAATGRLSSNDPNLQNIPIRTELGRPIRRAFEADTGYKLASLDYSQIELRVLAHMCEEPALVKAFKEGEDVHSVTAQGVFGLGEQAPTKEQRRLAKMLNYAVLYGVTEFGLARQLGPGFSIAEAKELIRQYNERFPSVHGFTQQIVAEARAKGYTTTMLGRRRYFPEIHASRLMDRKYAERQAMNAPIQGAAADMLKLAMIDVAKTLKSYKSRMLLTVHDELVFEVLPEEEAELTPLLASKMENSLPLNVPVVVDGKIGENWDQMKPMAVHGATTV